MNLYVDKWNPTMKNFYFGSRHGTFIYDLKLVGLYLRRTLYFLKVAIRNHQQILFIGDHVFMNTLIDYLATKTNQSSITNKWVSGTLTNWIKIKPYINFLNQTNIESIRKRFVLRTEKKIQQKITQYLKMLDLFRGVENLSAIPNLICYLKQPRIASEEAQKLHIPRVGLTSATFPIIGNGYYFDSLYFYTMLLIQAMRSGLSYKRILFLKRGKMSKAKKANFNHCRRNYRLYAYKRALRCI